MSRKNFIRVDVQVSIFTAIIIICSSMCMCIVNYKIAYNNMIHTLTDRVFSIYQYIEGSIDKVAVSNINSKSDEEVVEDVRKALAGEVVLPKDIKHTKWGKIFIAYFPVYNMDKVVGVIGIEFDAEDQYDSFLRMRIITPIIVIIACIICIIVAVRLFKRISNPNYRDLYNTDNLTELKNRNAYDTDMKNIIARKHQRDIGIVVLDLNRLKYINDNLGHQIGDEYIRCASDALKDSMSKNNVMYRIGGDEFVVIVQNTSKEEIENIISNIRLNLETRSNESGNKLSMAIGYAIYDKNLDRDVNDTYKRADIEMYKDKKEYYTST